MTRSVYIIGGAGAGKSTFTGHLLEGVEFGPLEDLLSLRNAKALVTLRGHRLPYDGVYLGCMRDEFPGSDGLDRASSPVGEAWLQKGDLPRFIISEGATLATRRFITSLHEHTELLLLHLHVDPMIVDLRFWKRGSSQKDSFVLNTETRSANLLRDMNKIGVFNMSIDTANLRDWDLALDLCRTHLEK